MIEEFLKDTNEVEAFTTGPAGSGKTTDLYDVVTYLLQHKVTFQVVAYTHKAKEVLISKLPEGTPISTLHSWLKKRPGINEKATHMKALLTSKQYGKPEPLELLIVDEFSFVGEKDYWSIGELQDELLLEESVSETMCEHCGSSNIALDKNNVDELWCNDCECKRDRAYKVVGEIPKPLKVLYVGDLNQLSPIDGPPAVQPHGPYWKKLTTIYRTNSEALDRPLRRLVDMIEGKIPMEYLEATEDFLRGQNINKLYKEDKNPNKIMLAFTNKAVQEHNAIIQGYTKPKVGDIVYDSSMKYEHTIADIQSTFIRLKSLPDEVTTANGEIDYDTKYNPLEYLDELDYIQFILTEENKAIPMIFGSYNNKLIREKLGKTLVELNKDNKNSKQAYREYKTVNDYVSVVDFAHCMTIHKSQGSEFDNVYVDSKDLSVCFDKQEMMKLLYVGISRAKMKIFLNN